MSRYRFWTPEEQQFLERNCKTMDIETIGNKLNRSVIAVKLKAENMGLTLKGIGKRKMKHELAQTDKNLKTKLNLGDRVKVTYLKDTSGVRNLSTKGRLIFKSKYIVTIKTKEYIESFNINDLRCKRIRIERM